MKDLDIQNISQRVSVAKSKNIFSVLVLPEKTTIKMYLLFLWVIAWTVCGLLLILSYPQTNNQNQKIFLIIFSFFWLYYEWRMVYIFSWRKWGKEKLWIKGNNIFIHQHLFKKASKVKGDDLSLLNEIKIEDYNEKIFSDFFQSSFWNKGKPRLKLNFAGKIYYFGYQLSDSEASKLIKVLRAVTKATN